MIRQRQAGAPFTNRQRLRAPANAGLPGSSMDALFAAGSISGAASFTSAFACTRVTSNGKATARKLDNTLRQFNDGELRITDRGLYGEEQRTNLIRNPSFAGASAPSTLPTNVNIFKDAGLTITVIETGTRDGYNYFRFRINGTTVSSSNILCLFETNSFIVSTAGLHMCALSTRLEAGSMAGTSNPRVILQEYTSGNSFVGSSTLGPLTFGANFVRGADQLTAVGTGGNNLRIFMQIDHGAGAALDFTIDVALPQVQKGAFTLSDIAGAGSQSTRNVDQITQNNPTTYVPLAGASIFGEYTDNVGPVSTDRYIFSYGIDTNNLIALFVSAADNKLHFVVLNGGVVQCDLVSTNAVVKDATYRFAVRWGLNSFAARYKGLGAQPANDNTGTMFAGSPTMNICHYGAGFNSLNGTINRLAEFTTGQADAALDAWVA